jgi:uncharacterized protein (TIGR02996 family)
MGFFRLVAKLTLLITAFSLLGMTGCANAGRDPWVGLVTGGVVGLHSGSRPAEWSGAVCSTFSSCPTTDRTKPIAGDLSLPQQTMSATDRDALLAAVLGDPADDTARLVLADCLRESDDEDDRARGGSCGRA